MQPPSPAVDFSKALDLKELRCPHPLLRTKKALARLQTGQTLHIIATDPSTPADFLQFCQRTGHELLASDAHDNQFFFIIRKR